MDDPAYKRLLTHRRIVWDLLIGFIAPLRPAGWAEALDFATLRDRRHRERHRRTAPAAR